MNNKDKDIEMYSLHHYIKIFLLYSILFILQTVRTTSENIVPSIIQFSSEKELWVQALMKKMTLDEKIGQLFMIQAYSNKNEKHAIKIDAIIRKYHIGGIAFFQGGPVRQAVLTNRFQELAKIPLFISMDLEWGLGMRLDSTINFPKQMVLGAIQNDKYIFQLGAEIARQCNRIGVHIGFAPVADINSNPSNPVIGMRSFGEDKTQVAKKAIAYMRGIQSNGIIATAKHFPGHGDTKQDSHITLPIIYHTKEQIENEGLYPFAQLIQKKVKGIMVGHLHIPAYDNKKNSISSLSRKIVQDITVKKLGFEGLIFTDALNMKGVTNFYPSDKISLKALLAGSDILLMPENLSKAFYSIKKAIEDKIVDEKSIDKKVKKILSFKYDAGLANLRPVSIKNLYEDLNTPKAIALKNILHEMSLTVVKNKGNFLPFTDLHKATFSSVSIGENKQNLFQEYLSMYAPFEKYQISRNAPSENYKKVFDKVKRKDCVVVSFHKMNNREKNRYGISTLSMNFIEELKKANRKVIIVIFGNPYSLQYFEKEDYLLCAYTDNATVQKAVPQILFGASKTEAKLPISASKKLSYRTGENILSTKRLGFCTPERVDMDSKKLKQIDSIVENAIQTKSMPGCQILVARKGKVVLQKSYGYHTYQKKLPVKNTDIYDIASMTKVIGSLQIIMSLEEHKFFDLNKRVADYLPEAKHTNKGQLILKDILTHQAGLVPTIGYMKNIMNIDNKSYDSHFLSSLRSNTHSVFIHDNLYARYDMQDSIWQWILNSPLNTKKNKYGFINYRYSDIGFYILKRIVERITKEFLHNYVERNLYRPLGLQKVTYLPLKKFHKNQIVPTEMDSQFRKNLVHGYVHDPLAALSGGIEGHAGIFSNALDIAIIMQMHLQGGFYGAQRYLEEKTLSKFNTAIYENNHNRRGIGWDKPMLKNVKNVSKYCSEYTFGHTGFTGTCVWIDPTYQLIYVFLSNRTYPRADNWKLIKDNIRIGIQDIIYESITK